MGHNIGVNAFQNVFHRHGQIAHGHGYIALFRVAVTEAGIIEWPHSPLFCQPRVGQKGFSGINNAHHSAANLLDVHGCTSQFLFLPFSGKEIFVSVKIQDSKNSNHSLMKKVSCSFLKKSSREHRAPTG
uniref:hypothetical protein n=1 Tax=uncultured Bilophila sp. TaxID=529385 RepID=UPI00345BD560